MIIPIRCFSCGKPVAQLWEEFDKRVKAGEKPKEIMDNLGLKRFCCRALFMGHVDLMHSIAQFKKA
ncbi:DNA-directed RNA polymerase subunit N [Candidatus Woesearchaeota archaeon]|jgi:DNA-directed RNA polymerase subunit N|nr:DNA-directed RNA polymerase subunit N [Candidatus Woesearchaeota archaeon]MBT7062943.1 DNA-directed RNA polymerase subunit N [Candidatus Woesearchaeota archaeon]MBT7402651.1 DNA-directed RNA polymerase subunit N [Candidatus Woesearchaeota archaeon]